MEYLEVTKVQASTLRMNSFGFVLLFKQGLNLAKAYLEPCGPDVLWKW